MRPDIDLGSYFARIGYSGPCAASLDVLHRLTAAHAMAIPFENLDVLLQRPIELDPLSLSRKLVKERRGGYCFEQNGLLLCVLRQIGFDAKPWSARVRLQRPREFLPPRTHMFIRVRLEREGEEWLTDVGVGGASLTCAIRFLEGEQPTPHEPRRLVREGDVWFHQIRYGDAWHDVYEFTSEEMPPIDQTVANWFTSAHPRSHFRDRLMAALALPHGRRVSLLDGSLTIRERDGSATTRALESPDELLQVLNDSFGLQFPEGTRFAAPGGLPTPWPS
jgi:N-hydroxyarylamine O-acetyltransferase